MSNWPNNRHHSYNSILLKNTFQPASTDYLDADDHICKPYSLRDATARVKAVLRRRQLGLPAHTAVQFEDDKFQARLHGQLLDLTVIEYKLLQLLAHTPGRIFACDSLMDRIYPDRLVVAARTIDSHVKKLRKKLAGHGQITMTLNRYMALATVSYYR
ncbi:winged helix-turn-helix domain-containing protein [Chitinivorax sp. B]|uniref:winged helix-turn-helix domain-containing protein n=1 Tax=Chitinivorax sp. B TaxID=2502235 RepID=UPI001484DC71|nr:winged helix-turn-helix domain-containing protein [Chitinivorax sp. B]